LPVSRKAICRTGFAFAPACGSEEGFGGAGVYGRVENPALPGRGFLRTLHAVGGWSQAGWRGIGDMLSTPGWNDKSLLPEVEKIMTAFGAVFSGIQKGLRRGEDPFATPSAKDRIHSVRGYSSA
jgi:hypothetical protein